jgi:glutathione S-transferase
MIKVYGSPRSSAGRTFWTLEEAGVPYENMPLNMKNKEHKSPEFLKINPNGKVPAMIDGDLILFESMAINFYLAETYKKDLLGKTPRENGLIHQWSFWALSELQPPIIEVFIQKVFVPEPQRNQATIDKNMAALPGLFLILDNALTKTKYLSGTEFSLADINTASVAMLASAIGFDTKPYANINRWFGAISDRPAYQKYSALLA